MGIAALVLGIISLILSCVSFSVILGYLSIVAFVLGVTGIVLAGIVIHKGGRATGGLVTSIIGTVFSFIPAIIWIIAIVAAANIATMAA